MNQVTGKQNQDPAQQEQVLLGLLQDMWLDYCALNPDAKKIYDLFSAAGEKVENDHIALRTFEHPKVGLHRLAQHFIQLGYHKKGDYKFIEKKLYAEHFEHSNPRMPKIFISELELNLVSPFAREVCLKLIEQIPEQVVVDPKFLYSGRHWQMSHQIYQELIKESEYAAWLAAFGFRPNHFTVNVNQLQAYDDLTKVNAFLKGHGFVMNTSGGEIKGSPQVYLEQSSTMASEIEIAFSDGNYKVPGCYYEFAKRYPMADGKLYQGFVEKSADKIFESTNQIR